MAVARTVLYVTRTASHTLHRAAWPSSLLSPCHTWDQLSPAGYSPRLLLCHTSLELVCEPRPGLRCDGPTWYLVLPARMARALEVRINLLLGAGKAAPVCSSTARNTVFRPGTVWARCVVRNRCGLRRCPPRCQTSISIGRCGAAALPGCLAAWLAGGLVDTKGRAELLTAPRLGRPTNYHKGSLLVRHSSCPSIDLLPLVGRPIAGLGPRVHGRLDKVERGRNGLTEQCTTRELRARVEWIPWDAIGCHWIGEHVGSGESLSEPTPAFVSHPIAHSAHPEPQPRTKRELLPGGRDSAISADCLPAFLEAACSLPICETPVFSWPSLRMDAAWLSPREGLTPSGRFGQ